MTSQLEQTRNVAASGVQPGPTGRPRVAALGMLVLVLLIGAAAALSLRPPAARPASAAATEFSADRALPLLRGIAAVPHPTGSAAAADVRDYLTAQLRTLGLEPELQSRLAARSPQGRRPTVGTVTNVHARIAGTQPTGRVVLVAHYDSVPTGPGAADNGANVAAVLEVARALLAGPPPRNDVDLLFTDAEEAGLLGAQAFVDSGTAGDPGRVVVVNLEARGVSGPAVMFQMAGTGLTGAVAAADPVTTSFAAAVYQVLPNDTDLTVFDQAGMRGLNFAFIDGAAHYHTPHDDIAHVDPASVQDMGGSVLAAVRQLAGADLAEDGAETTYFSLFGAVVAYPGWLDLPLTVLAIVGYVLLLWTGRRYGLRPRGVGRAAASFALTVPAVVVIGIGGWWALTLLRPDFQLSLGAVYRPGPYAAAEVAVLLAACVVWYRWARRRASPEEVAAGVLGWFVLFAALFAALLPGGAYLFIWPALVGVTALAAALRFTAAGSPLRTVAGCAAAVPGVALLLPIALLLVPTLSLALSTAPLLLVALLVAALATVLEPLPRRRRLTVATVGLLGIAAATAGVGLAVDGYDAARPQPVSLGYLLETDAGRATWISAGDPGQPAVGALLTGEPVILGDRLPPLGGDPLSSGPAPLTTAVVAPVADVLSRSTTAGAHEVRVRIRVPAGVFTLDVYTDTAAHEVVSATVDGADIAGGHNVSEQVAPGWRWGVRYVAPPADGVDLTVRVSGTAPVRLRVVTTAAGLPGDIGAPALGPDVSWTPWPIVPAQTYVVRTFTI